MSLSDQFCVDRHKPYFLNLVKNKLDIIFANEGEITSLISAKNFNDVISFGKELKKHLIITRGVKGAISINNNEVVEIGVKKDLKIVDLTGAGDLFAAGYLHGYINQFSQKECLKKGTELSSIFFLIYKYEFQQYVSLIQIDNPILFFVVLLN